MSSGIQNFRKQYPEYNDLQDSVLMDSFHKKYYSDLSQEDFMLRFNNKFSDKQPELNALDVLGS
ncbi:MAG: hypothetical protein ACUZ8H_09520, partial [Candidatus Anammoxibacter sp.]